MTLFAHASKESPVFLEALLKYFNGVMDELSEMMLDSQK